MNFARFFVGSLVAACASEEDPRGRGDSGGTPAPFEDAASGGTPGDAMTTDSGGHTPMGCSSRALPPGETTRTLRVGGVDRTYVLHVPPSYTGEAPVPLVIDFHFLFGTGAAERELSGYAALSDREGFVVAFPDGIDNAWNIGPCCTFSREVDDLGFTRALVRAIADEACVDETRVHAVGFSMGGGMSHFLACNAADVFASVAPAAFDLLEEMPCTPSRSIALLSFRGTADNVVHYEGGASNPPNGLDTTIHFLGAEATLERWADTSRCTGAPTLDENGCDVYSACDAGVEVGLCTVEGGGHEAGDAEIGWAFLQRHPMP